MIFELMVNFFFLLGPFIFAVENIKKRPAIPIVLHTAWACALSAIVIVFPHTIKMQIIQIKLQLQTMLLR